MESKVLGWIQPADEQHAKNVFSKYVADKAFPDEKKPYAVDLRRSTGTYLAVETGDDNRRDLLLDGASQIASLGLGFNARALFGVLHQSDAWINGKDSFDHQAVRKSYADLLRRQVGWPEGHVHFCNSGAEANEMALGVCFLQRRSLKAKKVLAFEGSFHGRMMVSLWSSWSPAKRVPFEWPGLQTFFAPYPESKDGAGVGVPAGWRELWADAPDKNFLVRLGGAVNAAGDDLLEREINSLLVVREQLMSGDYYAVIIEPMQCEGGDAYSTARFHNALANMIRAFGVGFVYDEVQTGFHLGREFFWHREFDLRDPRGARLTPDFVVSAKKAQVGVVISHEPLPYEEEYGSANLYRGFIQGSLLAQNYDRVRALETSVRVELQKLTSEFSEVICDPRLNGLAFAFRFCDAKKLNPFVALRFGESVMLYPAGSDTARFRLNLSFTDIEIRLLFQRLRNMLLKLEGRPAVEMPGPEAFLTKPAPTQNYEQHLKLLALRTAGGVGAIDRASLFAAVRDVVSGFLPAGQFSVEVIDRENFATFRSKIIDIEARCYEPARVTDIAEFSKCIERDGGVGIGILHGEKLMAMICGGPIAGYPLVRGTRSDPFFSTPGVFYMLCTTVDGTLQGSGLGQALKYSYTWLALQLGLERVTGRNRDHLAKNMLAINYAYGAVDLFRIADAYRDESPYRDSIYYSMPMRWSDSDLKLSDGISRWCEVSGLSTGFLRERAPDVVNKITLSNFVDEDYLRAQQRLLARLPAELRHAYTTSGQSECVDKLVKSIWYTRKNSFKLLTFEGCHFGEGSFLARALSGHAASHLPADRLPLDVARVREGLERVESSLAAGEFLAVMIEPLMQKSMTRVPLEFLRGLRELCTRFNVPLLFNETASQGYRYSRTNYFAGGEGGVLPDGGFAFLGGQMGLVFVSEKFFVSEPLALISTWDGDAYSLHGYTQGHSLAMNSPEAHHYLVDKFTEVLTSKLIESGIKNFELNNGCGWIAEDLPYSLSRYFSRDARSGRYIVYPNTGAMQRLVQE